MLALAAKIKARRDVAGIAYNIHDWPDDWLFRAMILQGGGRCSTRRRAPRLRRSRRPETMRYLRRFVTDANMPLIDWDQSRQQFIAGKIGIFTDTPARLRQVTDLIGDKFTLRTCVFPIDDKANGGLPTGGNAAIITAQDPQRSRRPRGSS
jgi:multiple sugar transport system substrate-binding protein